MTRQGCRGGGGGLEGSCVLEDVLLGSMEGTVCCLQGELLISWTSNFFGLSSCLEKKSPLESKMILENALGRQLALECEGISGVRGQNVIFPHLKIPGRGVQ